MSIFFIASQMIMLAACMSLGFIGNKAKIMGEGFDGNLSRLVLQVTLPAMIVSSVFNGAQMPSAQTIGEILGFAFLTYFVILAIAFVMPLLIAAPKSERGVYSFITAFGNVAFIGFPVLGAIFGNEAILYAAIFNIPFNVFVFTIGVAFVHKGEGSFLKKMRSNLKTLVSPVQISCLIAIGLALLGVTDGGLIGESLEIIGSMTTPAALLIVGSSLAKYSPKEMLGNWRAYVACAFRLIVVPLTVYAVFSPVVGNQLLLGVMVITSAMPVAANGLLICLQYGGNLKPMTQGLFISVIASIITIPCIAMLVV